MAEPQVTMEVAKGLAAGIAFERTSSFRPSLPADVEAALTRLEAGRTEESLKMLAGEICPYTKEDVAGVVKENLSSESRDKKTSQKKEPRRGTPERTRYDETLKIAEALRVYLESGGNNIPSELLPPIYDYLSRSPLFRDLIVDSNGALKSDEAQAIAKTLLQQPEVRKAILRLFTERLNPKKRLEHEEIVRQLSAEIAVLESQVIDVEQVNQDIQRIKNEIQTKNSQIISDPNYQEYLSLTSSLEDLNEELQTLQDTYKQARINNPQQLQQIASEINNRKNEIRRIQRELQDARFSNINSNLQEVGRLRQELQSLENKKAQASSKDQIDLRLQLTQKKQELQEAQALLTAERIKYASEVIAIPSEAVKEFLDEALGKAAKHYKEEAAKSAQEKEAEKKKLEQEALRKIGERLGTKKKKIRVNGVETEVAVPNKKAASELMSLLMQPNGLIEFGKKIVADLYDINTSTSPPTYTFKTDNRYGLTQEEADLIKDKLGSYDYLKTTGLPLAKAVMANYFLTGGRLNQDMVYALLNSEVGNSLIDDGKKLSKEKRDKLKNMVGEDVLTKFEEIKQSKGVEWLRNNWWKAGLGIAGILLLLVFGSKLIK